MHDGNQKQQGEKEGPYMAADSMLPVKGSNPPGIPAAHEQHMYSKQRSHFSSHRSSSAQN